MLRFVPLSGIYPHNMVGLREDGTLPVVAVCGLSNRAGETLEGAGVLMRRLGARDALIRDNGKDVMPGLGFRVRPGADGTGSARCLSMPAIPSAVRLVRYTVSLGGELPGCTLEG